MHRHYNIKKLIAGYLILICLFPAVLAGCSSASSEDNAQDSQEAVDADGDTQAEFETDLDVDDMFTERDLKNSYDEDGAVYIELTGGTASCSSTKVSIITDTIMILDEGTYIISGTLDDGMIIVDADDSDKVQLVLDGAEISNEDSAAVYIKNADKTFITTAEGSENTLTNGGDYDEIDDNNIDSVIFSKDDLTLNGLGTLTIIAKAGHGVVSKDDLKVTGGTIYIDAADHGMQAKDSIRIGGGEITIAAAEDGLHASNDDDDELGYIYIEDGNLEIEAGDDGIHASYAVLITGGEITVTESYEGIEGLSVEIAGGDITVTSSDDGLNAAGGNDESGFQGMGNDMFSAMDGVFIAISGGDVTVNASGDGVDSNGDLMITGGVILISGPTDNMNESLDYNGNFTISGGTLLAAGPSGMGGGMGGGFGGGSSSDETVTVSSLSGSEGSEIVLYDSEGSEIISWTVPKKFSSLTVYCGELAQGETCILSVDGSEQEISLEGSADGDGDSGGNGIINGIRNFFGGGGNGGGGNGGGSGRGGSAGGGGGK